MTTDNTHDEEPLAWCPGCGDRIPTEVIRERGVCSNCYGTTDDPWAAGRAETTTGAIARGEALAAGDPDWMNVTRWPQDATTTDDPHDDGGTRPTREQIDRAVGEVLVNAANHPDPVAVLGRSIAPLRTKITDAVLELLRDGAR